MELIKKKAKSETVKGKKDTNGCQFQRDNHSLSIPKDLQLV